ncbi:DNA-3-methyladenine glycosylase 2 [Ferrimicrobium acidiphilum]|uniref:DNA-3-methyladenine glycosylase 2 n=1 Tax=Ferrimicrobium acidiphilum TaxID=121039 RepID=UPI0023F2BFD8|nr:DNA-3-methyladenine glycosylase 2 [Ferrimicrobium acidiphilum]
MHEDFDSCFRAMQSKDARFDGWFVTAVITTGIYCRPSCPARSPLARNVAFYPTAAAAQQAGFRACKRCRPDASPGSPEWDSRQDLVARAMRLIADGVVDREGVAGLASRLNYSARQLERHLVAEVGAGPLALARASRAQTARLLIETTAMTYCDVAFAAGFSSIRQFNDTVRSVFACTPTELRVRATGRGTQLSAFDSGTPGSLTFRLSFRSPFAPESLFGHLAATGVPGCEEVRAGAYRRTLRLPNANGIVSLRPLGDHVSCRLVLQDLRDLPTAIARCRRLLDLNADPEAFTAGLSNDPALSGVVANSPGRRIPRTVDGAEMAVRVVLGQQVSTKAARTHASRLVAQHGTPIDDPDGGLSRVFPSPQELQSLDPEVLAMPRARRAALVALVGALADGTVELDVGADCRRARHHLAELSGIGPWSVELIAMRALGDPDAFPATDMGVVKGAAALGLPVSPAALVAHSRRWQPWRSYAVQYLWATQDHPINRWPQEEVACN